jgi:SulP family sulfate permease
MAGLTVAVMLVPQGMAYALLAGLPPIYGLYAGLVPLMIYPFFGSSRQLSVGPVALVSILILSGLSIYAAPFSPEFIELAMITALVAGVIQVLLSLLKMGFLVNFLSHPVINGFTAAAAIIIGLNQLNNILGYEVARTGFIADLIKDLVYGIKSTNIYTLIMGVSGMVIIIVFRKIKKSIPGALIAVILGIIATYLLGWQGNGVKIVGEVPGGLPAFVVPDLSLQKVINVLPLAIVICLVSFIESLSIAKTIAARHDKYPIHPNKELLGLGLAKIGGGFFLAYPNTGSFTRSAINDESGAKTGLASIFAALVVALTLIFFTDYFYYLPNAILAAIVLVAVSGLIDINIPKKLFSDHRKDFYAYLATFAGTLIFGIQTGVLLGIVLSLLLIIYKASKPSYAVLGNLEGTEDYRNIIRFENAVTTEGLLILRYDDDIFFGNGEHFYETIVDKISNTDDIQCFLLEATSISHIDSTGMEQIELLAEYLEKQNIEFLISGIKGPVRDLFYKTGFNEHLPFDKQFLNIHAGVNYFKSTQLERGKDEEYYIKQTNHKKE